MAFNCNCFTEERKNIELDSHALMIFFLKRLIMWKLRNREKVRCSKHSIALATGTRVQEWAVTITSGTRGKDTVRTTEVIKSPIIWSKLKCLSSCKDTFVSFSYRFNSLSVRSASVFFQQLQGRLSVTLSYKWNI